MSLADDLYSFLTASKEAGDPGRPVGSHPGPTPGPVGAPHRSRGGGGGYGHLKRISLSPIRSSCYKKPRVTNVVGGAYSHQPIVEPINATVKYQKLRRGGAFRSQGPWGRSGFRPSEGAGSVSRAESVQGSLCKVTPLGGNKKLILGYKRLQDLCEKSPVDIVAILMNPRTGFSELLNSTLRPDLLMLVMKVLSEAIHCEFDGNRTELLAMVCHSSSKLFDSILTYLSGMPADEDANRNDNAGNFISHLLNFYEVVMKKLPNTASEKLKQIFIATDMAMVGIVKYRNVDLKEQRDMFDRLFQKLRIMIEERGMTRQKTDSKNECLQHMRPPDDFRQKSVFPQVEELLVERKAFVRPNVVEGAFRDVDDYLDIQFRLLREDFIAPLRQGIATYLSFDKNTKGRIDNIKLYRDVLFGDPKVINDDVGVTVIFDPRKKMKIKWEFSKRLMFGSLVLFTNDNFQTIFFGTVLHRDCKMLAEGKVIVHIEDGKEVGNLYGGSFLMVESEVFFEPYRHVMTALKKLEETSFPMKRYIVYVENNPRPPNYILADPERPYNVDAFQFEPLSDGLWPSGSDLLLDESQYEAFKAALTQEIVVIQGPPGTGKTFLGLKIAQVLLNNKDIWNTDGTPILVVCFTNHALDQFLEALVPVTDLLVRVGGQSKSKSLEKYNLREKRKCYESKGPHFAVKRSYFHKMSEKMLSIKRLLAYIEGLQRHRGVISSEILVKHDLLPAHHARYFTEHGDDAMLEWLSNLPMDSENAFRGPRPQDSEVGGGEDFLLEDRSRGLETIDFDHEDFSSQDAEFVLEFAVDIDCLEMKKKSMAKELRSFENGQESVCINKMDYLKCLDVYKMLSNEIDYWMYCLRINFSAPLREIRRLERIKSLWHLSPIERWTLYTSWVNKLKVILRSECTKLEREYRRVASLHNETKHMCDLQILRESLVVGMTTTNAARLHSQLQALRPKIVIVEEAAEVLESHIVVSIAKQTDHVILIGDHQQLRPATSVFRLARDFHMNISLFERMLKNGLPCFTLNTQHRMRPEIASLITPIIYPHLKNHLSVQGLPAVRGIASSLFFVCHEMPEEQVEDISSHKNAHEADFLLALCRYLLLQGYAPEDITVLTTYKGQLFYMKVKQRNSDLLSNVNINVVDNYQGEENKIILLSLVRSNKENKIGFLKEDNRVCVALSRAKEGMYIIGNMEVLAASSTIWPQVKRALEVQGALGPQLLLRCQVHPNKVTHVVSADDFQKVPEGGCLLPCAAFLPCGHRCESICHVNDREHLQFKCQERCQRIPPDCSLNHLCPKICWEECGRCESEVPRTLPCGHEKVLHCFIDLQTYKCPEKVQVELPSCKHLVEKPCHHDTASFPCTEPCPNRLPCGHACKRLCHADDDPDHLEYKCMKPCPRKNAGCSSWHACVKLCHEECGECVVEVYKELPACGHWLKVKCSVDASRVKCKKGCEKKMECGHICRRKCFQECGGCQVKVQKKIPSCGHELNTICSEPANPQKCCKPCERSLLCGHHCNKKCGEPCTENCLQIVKCQISIPCGHNIEIPCYLQKSGPQNELQEVLLAFCQEPCMQQLQCGHMCPGSCGKCLQGRLHVPCTQQCGRALICTHKCRVPCAAACPPCTAKCANRCRHSRCPKPCGAPCDPCLEPCDRRCRHARCNRRCSEPCEVPPCVEACPRRLRCGHPCVGFCGDRCPPLCRVCNAEELTEIFFGGEDEEDARFVYLEDCKHTLEAKGLESWLQRSDGVISLKTCPRCSSYIQRTKRYADYVKAAFQDVAQVKAMVYGEMDRLKFERNHLLQQLDGQITSNYILQYSEVYSRLLRKLKNGLRVSGPSGKGRRRNFLSAAAVQSVSCELQIIKDLVSSVTIAKGEGVLLSETREKIFRKFDFLVERVGERHKQMSEQEARDLSRECERFRCLALLVAAEGGLGWAAVVGGDAALAARHREARALLEAPGAWAEAEAARARAAVAEVTRAAGVAAAAAAVEERRSIVRAMGVMRGAWYKCPNGHVYCITECGGAMERSVCPECKEPIGGENHRVLRSNRLAPEMDGAAEPAYPQGADFLLR